MKVDSNSASQFFYDNTSQTDLKIYYYQTNQDKHSFPSVSTQNLYYFIKTMSINTH